MPFLSVHVIKTDGVAQSTQKMSARLHTFPLCCTYLLSNLNAMTSKQYYTDTSSIPEKDSALCESTNGKLHMTISQGLTYFSVNKKS
jgi:hypothetical protein